jgi:two-component system CheB/CheR fusion protein
MRIGHLFDDPEIRTKLLSYEQDAKEKYARLTSQQKQILDLMIEGHPTKIIAYKLGISTRTAENHRASIMDRTGAKSLVTLMRIYLLSA